MRRMTAVVTVCLCVGAGCRGGAAQGPYDGIGVVARAPTAEPIPEAPTVAPEPIASEVDVPWTIALLSDTEALPVEDYDRAVHVESAAAVAEPSQEQEAADLEVAFDHEPPDHKPPTSGKSCPGVVKGRS